MLDETPTGIIFAEPKVIGINTTYKPDKIVPAQINKGAKIDQVNQSEKEGLVETNRGRIIESDDLLFYTDRRGPEAFTKLLVEGKILAPALAKKKGEEFRDQRGEKIPLMSTVNEPNTIYTSLFGPYWGDSCSLVFNAWDTLENFSFYDQGNTGLKLYSRENDDNPADFRFKNLENNTETEFLILEPEHEQGNKMRQTFIESMKGTMTPEEATTWLDNHIVSIWEIKKAAWNNAEALLNQNPEYSVALKSDLQSILDEVHSKTDPLSTEIQRKVAWLLKNDNNVNLAEWFAFRIHGFNYFAQDHSSGSIDNFIRSKESADGYSPEWRSQDKTITEPLTKLTQEFVGKMQKWLKQDFQKKYGPKTGRKAEIKSEGPDTNKRMTLTIK